MIEDDGSSYDGEDDTEELDEASASRAANRRATRAVTVLTGIVATVLLGWVLSQGAGILQPIVIAMLLCSVLAPVVRLLRKLGIPSAVTVLALLVALVMGVERGANLLISDYNIDPAAPGEIPIVGDIGTLKQRLLTKAQEEWGVPPVIANAVGTYPLQEKLIALGFSVGDFIRGLFLVTIYMIFIFAEAKVFRRKILAVAKNRNREEEAERVMNSITFGIQRYLGVKTVTSLATGVVCYTVMQLLGLPYAALFGLLTFLLNYIPTFGSFAAAVPPIAMAIGEYDAVFPDATIIAATYLITNILIGGILDPRMLGRELNLSPLVVLVSVVFWAAMWGVPGMFLAVPLTATAQIVMANIESTRPIAMLLSNGPPALRRRRKKALETSDSDLPRAA